MPASACVTLALVGTPEAMGSLKVTASASPSSMRPGVPPAWLVEATLTGTGGALSAGAVGPKPEALQPPLGVKATVKVPTDVSGSPAPSVRFKVARVPPAATAPSDPPEGAPASVQPVWHPAPSVPEKLATTWSTLPLWSLSYIWRALSTGCVVVVVVDGGMVVVVEEVVVDVVVAGALRSGAPEMTMRAVWLWVVTGTKGDEPRWTQVNFTSMRSWSSTTVPKRQGSGVRVPGAVWLSRQRTAAVGDEMVPARRLDTASTMAW